MKERKRKTIDIDGVFDIETEDWDKFVIGDFHTSDGGHYVRDFRKEDEFAEAIIASRGSFWAHNLGGFDGKWLLDHMVKRGVHAEIIAPGSDIVMITAGELKLFDSYALVKISLAEFSKASGVEKIETGLPCVCKKDCGGYCSITRQMSPLYWRRIEEYLVRDCEGLFKSLLKLKEFGETNDIDLCATVGSSAWNTAYRLCDIGPNSLGGPDHTFARGAYFGGRVQLFKPSPYRGMVSSVAGYQYDVSSMYPSRLAFCELPIGKTVRVSGPDAMRFFCAQFPGIYRVSILIPDLYFPPLPVRAGQAIYYPTGAFDGTWTLPELEFAVECGAEILDVKEALVFKSKRIVFADLVNRLFDLRAGAPGGKSGPLGTFIKYLLNSLTGKFGSRPDKQLVEIGVEDPRKCPGTGECAAQCSGYCGAHKPLDEAGLIVSSLVWRLDPCAHIEWAAYLTSQARIEWCREAMHSGENATIYGDTDSLFTEKKLTRNVGNKLGEWMLECTYKNFLGIAPKVYSYEGFDCKEPGLKVKGKGLSLPRKSKLDKMAPSDKERILREASHQIDFGLEVVREGGIVGFKTGINGSRFFRKNEKMGRHVQRGVGDRIAVFSGGRHNTRPRTIAEVLEVEKCLG